MLAVLLIPATPAAANFGTELPDGFAAMVVNPAKGHVYVSSAESSTVTVLDFSGRIVKVIADEPGASGMALVDGTLYVALSTGGALDAIDTGTLTRTRRLAQEKLFKPEALAYAGGRLWTAVGEWEHKFLIAVDPATGAISEYPSPIRYRMQLIGHPQDPNMLIGWDNLSSANITRWDASTDPPTVTLSRSSDGLANLKDIAVSPDGTKLFPASGWPYEIDEYRTSDLAPSGIVYVTGNYPIATAVTPGRGGLMAAGMSHGDPPVQVFRLGQPSQRVMTHDFGRAGGLFDRALEFSPDGSRLFAVTGTEDYYWGRGNARFHALRIDPADAYGTGMNAFGQLGDGTTTDRNPAVRIPGLDTVKEVSAGALHTLAIQDGAVWAWGYNGFGQLGNASTRDSAEPDRTGELRDAISVSAGFVHSLALTRQGSVVAWGSNAFGQLGDGTTQDRINPVVVPNLNDVVAISAGTFHNLALKADGSVWAWGWNGLGQLGDGTRIDRSRPVRVLNLYDVRAVAAGGYHSLAVGRTDGRAYSWGWNAFGQLGDGSTADRIYARPVPGTTGVVDAAAGYLHSFSVSSAGAVRAWGSNAVNQLGDGTSVDRRSPVAVSFPAPVDQISGGLLHSVALSGDRAFAWGWNALGQLGEGSLVDRPQPTPISNSEGAVTVSAGGYSTFFTVGRPAP